ncbi:MAG: PH domain-containing protein [Deltaproteobacteria bacterium]|nr:PH domain-containing protein [Deltaproteobacteria bacterium]
MSAGFKFNAPWGLSLKLITAFSVVILVGISVIGLFWGPHGNIIWILGTIFTPLLMLAGAASFMIRGYIITEQSLLVQRLGWNSELSLNNLLFVEFDPEAMKKSIRAFGNGGLFCFAGKFQNNKLGSYRAYATNPDLSVVLKFKDRVVVITPETPDKFVNKIKEAIK